LMDEKFIPIARSAYRGVPPSARFFEIELMDEKFIPIARSAYRGVPPSARFFEI
jgi:hypothetical protein